MQHFPNLSHSRVPGWLNQAKLEDLGLLLDSIVFGCGTFSSKASLRTSGLGNNTVCETPN